MEYANDDGGERKGSKWETGGKLRLHGVVEEGTSWSLLEKYSGWFMAASISAKICPAKTDAVGALSMISRALDEFLRRSKKRFD